MPPFRIAAGKGKSTYGIGPVFDDLDDAREALSEAERFEAPAPPTFAVAPETIPVEERLRPSLARTIFEHADEKVRVEELVSDPTPTMAEIAERENVAQKTLRERHRGLSDEQIVVLYETSHWETR